MIRRPQLRSRSLWVGCWLLAALLLSGFEPPDVRVEPNVAGPRTLESQTEKAVIRDYLKSWQSLSQALAQNRVDLLDADFVGVAREKLAETIRQQQELAMRTSYQDRAHDLRLVFYSPEGLSVQLVDTVEYDVQIKDHDQTWGTQRLRTRYVVVLTPTEVRWKVRVFQAQPA